MFVEDLPMYASWPVAVVFILYFFFIINMFVFLSGIFNFRFLYSFLAPAPRIRADAGGDTLVRAKVKTSFSGAPIIRVIIFSRIFTLVSATTFTTRCV